MEDVALILEKEFNVSSDIIWHAITDKESMTKWYFEITDFKLLVGYKFQFEGGEENKRYNHLCEIIEIIPKEKLKYSWKYEGYTGLSFVTFEISANGDKTTLKLTHEGIETFDNPDFIRSNFVSGWDYLINESLHQFIEKGKGLRYW